MATPQSFWMKRSEPEQYMNSLTIAALQKKSNFKKAVCFLLFVAITLGLGSCETKRSIIKAPIKEEGAEFLFERLRENELKFNTFTARLNVEYTVDKSRNDFKGQLRIVKDSAIWVSFNQDLGIEIARFLITEDSVKFLDRINRTYFAGDYYFVNNFLDANIDFGILQSLLLGNDFEYYDDVDFKASIDGGQYRLMTTGRHKLRKYVRNHADHHRLLLQAIWLDPESFKITAIRLKELTQNSKKLTAGYSGFQSIDNQKFPTQLNYSIEADVPINVTVRYSRITLNGSAAMPFNVPESYTRLR
jgi:hypothetical protein